MFSGWIVALWPFAVWETKVTVPENLLLALVPAGLLALAHAGRIPCAILTGIIGAAMTLTHPVYLVVLFPFAAGVVWTSTDRLAKLVALSLLLAAFCAPIGLWVLRSHRLGYDGIATGFGYNYFRGVYAFDVLLAGRRYFRDHDEPAFAFVNERLRAAGLEPYDSNLRRSDPPLNTFLDRLAIRHLKAHPLYSAAKVLVKMPLAWVQQQTPLRSAFNAALLAPLFALVPAPARGGRRRERLGTIFLTILAVNAAFAAIAVEAIPMRYMLPLVSPLAMLAGAGLFARRPPAGQEHSPARS